MNSDLLTGGYGAGLASTQRTDRWWIGPCLTFLGLAAFGIYSTWAALQGNHYWYGPYLSPFYSPLLFVDPAAAGAAPLGHAWLGLWPAWWPKFLPISPAILVLAFPLSFRATCYYYRKAYYRAYFLTPPGCAVTALPQKSYRGETTLLIFQNLHRYALYFAIVFIFILFYDALCAFFRNGKLGMGVGSIVLLINASLLAGYTFGCHCWRHLVGGRRNTFCHSACGRLSYQAWQHASFLNQRHSLFAWASLFWVGFADLYVRLTSMGVIKDWNTWN